MKEISKKKKNLLSLAISGIGLVFTVIGVLVGIVPLILATYVQYGVFVTSIVLEATVLIPLFQVIITAIMFVNIRNEGIDKQSLSTESITIILSILNLFFLQLTGLLFYAGKTVLIFGQLLFIVPIITIIAGIIFSDYKETHGVRKRTILYVLGIVLLAIILSILIDNFAWLPFSLFPLIFGFIGFTYTLILLVYVIVLLELAIFLPAFFASMFIVYWDDRSQLLNKPILISLGTAALSTVLGNVLTLFDVIPSLVLALLFSVMFSFVFKALIYKRFKMGEIQELIPLEKNKVSFDQMNDYTLKP